MRRLLLISITFLSCLLVKGQTNIYHTFPDSNTVWNFHFRFVPVGGNGSESDYSISFSGDTIISRQTYHKLKSASNYEGAIREDVGEKKVYFIHPTDSTEKLLYDFNMQVGDTVQGYIQTLGLDANDVVISIDSVLIGSTYRKRWHINNCYNIYFIEGIGSTYGLIEQSPGCATDLFDYSLICFKQDGQTLYPDTSTTCNLITGIDETPNQIGVSTIGLYPNPAQDQLNISIGQGKSIQSIRLYDLMGREQTIEIEQRDRNNYSLHIRTIPKGIYIINIILENGKNMSKKVLKQ